MFLVLLTDLTSVDDCEQYVLTTEIFRAEGHGFDCLHLIHILLHAFPLPHLWWSQTLGKVKKPGEYQVITTEGQH